MNKRFNVLRAHFSALTKKDIVYACNNLKLPDKNLADAVSCRQEMDLRIGAIFTRFQTLYFREKLGLAFGSILRYTIIVIFISYGPCQFPTLGFIVERFQQIRGFQSEKFWNIDLFLEK